VFLAGVRRCRPRGASVLSGALRCLASGTIVKGRARPRSYGGLRSLSTPGILRAPTRAPAHQLGLGGLGRSDESARDLGQAGLLFVLECSSTPGAPEPAATGRSRSSACRPPPSSRHSAATRSKLYVAGVELDLNAIKRRPSDFTSVAPGLGEARRALVRCQLTRLHALASAASRH